MGSRVQIPSLTPQNINESSYLAAFFVCGRWISGGSLLGCIFWTSKAHWTASFLSGSIYLLNASDTWRVHPPLNLFYCKLIFQRHISCMACRSVTWLIGNHDGTSWTKGNWALGSIFIWKNQATRWILSWFVVGAAHDVHGRPMADIWYLRKFYKLIAAWACHGQFWYFSFE